MKGGYGAGRIAGWCGAALVASLACALPALAQTTGNPAASPLANPMFAAPAVPDGMVDLQGSAASPYISPDRQIHGYLSTGVSTNGGRGVSGGVVLPILPGTATLEVGGGTGQFGVRVPVVTAQGITSKKATITSDSYYATLHIHPVADVEMDLSVSGARLHLPGQAYPGQPYLGQGFSGPQPPPGP